MSEHKPSILYLDDERQCLEVFCLTFGDDYEVRTASEPSEARRELAERPFDIVISDQSMPEIRGADFLREVAAAHPKCYRMMLTGNSSVGEMLREISEGVINGFLTKPWRSEDVRQALERALLSGGARPPRPSRQSADAHGPGRSVSRRAAAN